MDKHKHKHRKHIANRISKLERPIRNMIMRLDQVASALTRAALDPVLGSLQHQEQPAVLCTTCHTCCLSFALLYHVSHRHLALASPPARSICCTMMIDQSESAIWESTGFTVSGQRSSLRAQMLSAESLSLVRLPVRCGTFGQLDCPVRRPRRLETSQEYQRDGRRLLCRALMMMTMMIMIVIMQHWWRS